MTKAPPPIITAKITALSHDGRGITQIDHKTTFVRGALEDEEVELTLTRRHSNYNEGLALRILKASPHRVEPKCPHFAICGGSDPFFR